MKIEELFCIAPPIPSDISLNYIRAEQLEKSYREIERKLFETIENSNNMTKNSDTYPYGAKYQPSVESTKIEPVIDARSKIQILKEEYPVIYEGFKKIQEEQFELFAGKHLDYGMTNVMAGTQLETDEDVHFVLTGIWFRLTDKVNRWKTFMTTKRAFFTKDEKLSDTFQDISNYAVISQLILRGMWRK